MGDGNNASGEAGARDHVVKFKVNGRQVGVDVETSSITQGPPALMGKYMSQDQLVDMLEAGDVEHTSHLCVVDDIAKIRLADAEYEFLRMRESKVEHSFKPGDIVQYRRREWVVETLAENGDVNMSFEGRVLCVPKTRLVEVGHAGVSTAKPNPYRDARPLESSAPQASVHEGDITFDDGELEKIILERFDKMLESDDFVDKLAKRLMPTIQDMVEDSPGDEIAAEGEATHDDSNT